MGGFIPLGDASRPPGRSAPVTVLIVLVNVFVFFQELTYGDRFVRAWSVIPIHIIHGHHLITLVTSMFMHGGWMHIIGNMVYLWAFGRAIEDAMGGVRFLLFYLAGGIVAMFAQILGDPYSHFPASAPAEPSPQSWEHSSSPFLATASRTFLFFFIFFRITFIPGRPAYRFLVSHAGPQHRHGRRSPHRRRRVPRPHRRIPLRRDHRKAVREPPQDDLQPLQLNHSRKP